MLVLLCQLAEVAPTAVLDILTPMCHDMLSFVAHTT
jgi:hypothetical protein